MRSQPAKSVGEIAGELGLPAFGELLITGLALATSEVRPGDLFIALPGARTHGARYVDEAARRGAVAILTDPEGAAIADSSSLPTLVVPQTRERVGALASWFYDHPSLAMNVMGITGTNGKTTSTFLLEAALRGAGHRTGLIGTVQTRSGDHVLPSTRTTPEAPELQRLFAEMRELDVSAVAMEVSSHALSLGRVAGTHFAVSAFTNLSQDHLDFHGSMEEYFKAKALLFTADYSANAIVCVDDDYGRRLARETEIPLVTVSIQGPADWWISQVHLSSSGSRSSIHTPDGESGELSIQLPGRYNLANALVAVACATSIGAPLGDALRGVSECAGVPGRMERVDLGQPFAAIVDYAHTPDAVERVLAQLRGLTEGRIIAVLGCGGDRDAGKRPLMGRAVAEGSDLAILTNDNPRSEDPKEILFAMEQGARAVADARVAVEPDRRAAIRLAVSEARDGDIVVVAGKGHEQGQEVGGAVLPFDDRDELRKAIEQVVA